MSCFTMRPFAIPQKRIASRLRQQHEGEILGAHRRFDVALTFSFPTTSAIIDAAKCVCSASLIVRRIVAMKIDGNFALVGRRSRLAIFRIRRSIRSSVSQ